MTDDSVLSVLSVILMTKVHFLTSFYSVILFHRHMLLSGCGLQSCKDIMKDCHCHWFYWLKYKCLACIN